MRSMTDRGWVVPIAALVLVFAMAAAAWAATGDEAAEPEAGLLQATEDAPDEALPFGFGGGPGMRDGGFGGHGHMGGMGGFMGRAPLDDETRQQLEELRDQQRAILEEQRNEQLDEFAEQMSEEDRARFNELRDQAETQRDALDEARDTLRGTMDEIRDLVQQYLTDDAGSGAEGTSLEAL